MTTDLIQSTDDEGKGRWIEVEDVVSMTASELEALERAQYGGREGKDVSQHDFEKALEDRPF